MENLTPTNIAAFIRKLIDDGVIAGQAEMVNTHGFDKGTLSNILSGKKNAGWKFVAKFKAAYPKLLSTLENSGQLSDGGEKYQVTLHEPGKRRLYVDPPPERSDGDTLHVLVMTNSKQAETISRQADIINRQQVTMERLLKRIDTYQKNGVAGLDANAPKTKAG